MIDKATVDRIYAAANIVDVVGDFVTLRKNGVNYTACCPFHNEKTPSFVVSPARGIYKCFGCGKGGNAITFVMEHERLTYTEALKWVAKKYGIEVHEREQTEEEIQRNNDRESMLVASAWAAEYFAAQLFDTDEGLSIARSYFAQRGLTDATIKKFGLGYCPKGGDQMTQAALKAGYKEKFLVESGLTIKRETGGYYDRFCGRVQFPVHTISGRVTAFSGRAMQADNRAKYLNSPESEIYSKSNNLYGIYFAKSAITKENLCIVVEGNIDVVQMHQKGIENVVAPLGTALTVEQVRMIARFTNNITLLFDGDSAGIKAALKGVDLVLKEGMNVRVVVLPEGEDPDSYARKHTAEEVRKFIADNQRDFVAFKSSLYADEAAKDPIRKAELIGDIVRTISLIPNEIQRSLFVRECAQIMDVDEAMLTSEVVRKRMGAEYGRGASDFARNQQQLQRQTDTPTAATQVQLAPQKGGSSRVELEKELVGYLIKYGHRTLNYRQGREMVTYQAADAILSNIEEDVNLTFSDGRYRALVECYKAHRDECAEGEAVPEHYFVELDNPEASSAAVDILTEGDHHKQSQIWKERDIYVDSEEQRVGKNIPRAIMLYKSKVIESLIEEQQRRLDDEELGEEEVERILSIIKALNEQRKGIATTISRNIL